MDSDAMMPGGRFSEASSKRLGIIAWPGGPSRCRGGPGEGLNLAEG